ncbi:MAG: hypothetical protein LUD46_19890, partial [Parabacteroides sp.]|nr:hypothetical protein [Parabacteroides sp.]
MMKNFNMALRSLFKKGRSNGIKILALAVGLAMGLVLVAKVCFERSYDNFYPDNDRIYLVKSDINREGKKDSWGQVSGAIAPGMKAEVPGVEFATRYTRIGGDDELIMTPAEQYYTATILLADTSFFDIFPPPGPTGWGARKMPWHGPGTGGAPGGGASRGGGGG